VRIAALVAIAAGIGWCVFLFAGGIYRLVDAKAGHGSILGLVLIPFVVGVLVWAGIRVWRDFGGSARLGAPKENDV
jgi:hypothetical protein